MKGLINGNRLTCRKLELLRAVLNFYLLLADKLPALIGCSCIVEQHKGIIEPLKARNKSKKIAIIFSVKLTQNFSLPIFFNSLLSSILFVFVTTVRLQLQRTETSRSSTVSITENHVLMGCGIQKQRSYSFLSCVHLCLARSDCASVNYENVRNGMCELNRLPSPTDVMNTSTLTFIARPGYSFGQLGVSIFFTFVFLILSSFSLETRLCNA